MSVLRHEHASSAPKAPASSAEGNDPPAPQVSSIRQLLDSPEEIRRDSTPSPQPIRVAMPRPTAEAIEAIDALYASKSAWEALSESIERARPYVLPRARFVMVIETNRAFDRMGINKIMTSLLKDNDDTAVKEQIDHQQIGQISKGRRGDICVKVKTRAACQQLANKEVRLLGKMYKFQDFDILADRFFIDVSSVDSAFDDQRMLRRFFDIGAEPIYGTFRDVNLEAAMTTSTWRVYFRSNRVPDQLVVGGRPCDQLMLDGRLYPVLAKDAAFPSQRRGFGQSSPHLLDLTEQDDAASTPAAPEGPVAAKTRSYATVVKDGKPAPKQPSTSKPEAKKARKAPASEISLSVQSDAGITPPGSPKAAPSPAPKSLPAPETKHVSSNRRNAKRQRCAEDFATILQKVPAKVSQDVTTSNYFDVLDTIEYELESCDASLGKDSSPRFQIVPQRVTVPESVKSSKESSHFLKRSHTSVSKTKEATPIPDVAQVLVAAEEAGNSSLAPPKLLQAAARVESIRKTLLTTPNPDTIGYMAVVNDSVAFNAALLGEMRDCSGSVEEVAQLHMVNRVLSAADTSSCKTFPAKWAAVIGEKLPKKREDMLRTLAHLWKDDNLSQLIRATRALSLFELMLMCTAPQIFQKDEWIQRITGQPVAWIPTTNCRLLHPNTLIALLRSELGNRCIQMWEMVQWQGQTFDDLDYLRSAEVHYPDDGVLKLTAVCGQATLMAGPITMSN